ncbi:uncharacterized protein LOC130699670 [Daphnia carinata]|uniref:uncharacterized protein LOC130699670 n=1 Tax=Daphnia carinata TaxID=120202 RepID=UPI002580F6B7|nr:uncharacterized protein LOC130699670 [Daphnia carinata]
MSSTTICTSCGSNYTCKLYFDPGADKADMGGYWITDDQLRQILSNLINTEEKIEKASIYSNPLSVGKKLQLANRIFYHAYVVIKTKNWWWSIEKNTECITIQRSESLESVRDMYQKKKRLTGPTTETSIREKKTALPDKTITIIELINYIWRKDYLNDVNHLVNANCQKFADAIFNRIKSPWDDHVYFDEAADHPRSSASSCYMSVDKFFSQVQRLSNSETLSELELYTVKRVKSVTFVNNIMYVFIFILLFLLFLTKDIIFLSDITIRFFLFFVLFLFGYAVVAYVIVDAILDQYGLLSRHSFVIFKTKTETYWSFERFPTHFVIHRARTKDILLKECKRASQDIWFFIPQLHSKALAAERSTIAILDFIWKKDNLNSVSQLPLEDCGQVASIIFENFKRPTICGNESFFVFLLYLFLFFLFINWLNSKFLQ